jgi:hypothetical protein
MAFRIILFCKQTHLFIVLGFLRLEFNVHLEDGNSIVYRNVRYNFQHSTRHIPESRSCTYLFIVWNRITWLLPVTVWVREPNYFRGSLVIKELGCTRDVCLHGTNTETIQGGGDVWSRKNKVWALGRTTGWTTIMKFDGLALGKLPSCILDCVIDIGLLFSCYVIFNNSDDELIINRGIR